MQSHRYYQPRNSKDAMRYIEKLFNRYRNAPLTLPLLQYHQKLMRQLRTNVCQVAKREKIPARIKDAKQMYHIMNQWIQIRIAGHPFPNKMRHFKIVTHHRKFKAHRIRIANGHQLKSSRH